MKYEVVESTPGYLPDDMDTPADFESRAAAIAYAESLVAELREEGHHIKRVGDKWFAERSKRDLGRVVEVIEGAVA